MTCQYSGCNYPEGECSGECLAAKNTRTDMTQDTNITLEEIVNRVFGAPHTIFRHEIHALLSDPSILAHVPGVVALREENERLRNLAEHRVPASKYMQALERIADLESQLAALQAGEPVHWRAVLDAGQIHPDSEIIDTPLVIGFTKEESAKNWIAEKKDFGGWKYTLEPLFVQAPASVQPAIAGKVPPGYALVPIEPTTEMVQAGKVWVFTPDQAPTARSVWEAMLAASPSAQITEQVARPLSEYHEDMGCVVWWKFPVIEPSYIGSPTCSDWPGYHTHFTPHPDVPKASAESGG